MERKEKEKKINYLFELFINIGKQKPLKLAKAELNSNGSIFWTKWKDIKDLDSESKFLENVNNRTILYNEIVLDIDCKTKEEAKKQYDKIILDLKKEDYSYKAYFTGSKGYHIHLFFEDLFYIKEEDLKRIKEEFISKYDCDMQKAANKTMIALEDCPHWKTGNKKTLIEEKNNGINSKGKLKNFLEKDTQEKDIDSRFYSNDLLKHIFIELDKDHKEDNLEKLGVFLVRTTAELLNPNDRQSVALKGESSAGKDNVIKAVFKHFPEEDQFILTRGTQSALEERANKVKAIAFSEINANRENGANKDLTEFFKQLAEGGCRIIKRNQKQEIVDIRTEQKSLFYGTTETQTDDELETRYVIIPIRSNKEKNKVVVNDTLQTSSNPHLYFSKKDRNSWIKQSIEKLDHDLDVLIPFAEELKKPIKNDNGKDVYIFDYRKDRIKRDVKRLLALTKAVTWLYQKQRVIDTYTDEKGKEFNYLVAEPTDFITAYFIFDEFFKITYSGLDFRHQQLFEKIKELEGKHDSEILTLGYDSEYFGWVLRHRLQEELGIQSTNTIKKRIDVLKDFDLIDWKYDYSKPKAYLLKSKKSRVSLGYHLGIKGYQLDSLDTLLTPYLTPSNIESIYKGKTPLKINLDFYPKKATFFSKMTPSTLTPSNLTKIDSSKLLNLKEKILEKLPKKEISIKDIISNFEVLDFSKKEIEESLNKLKEEGLISETKKDYIIKV